MRAAGQLAAAALQFAGSLVRPGVTTDTLDRQVHAFIISHGAYPSPLGYLGFPRSICTSVNECVCHGIPDSRPLQEGDIVNVDVSVYLNGHHGDTSDTFTVGRVQEHAAELIMVTRSALAAAIACCGPGVPYRTIGATIQRIAHAHGMSVIREFLGHGIGNAFHTKPNILHYINHRPGRMVVGSTFTIEPILTLGGAHISGWPDGWTHVTSDASLAAQQEHMLLITYDGVEVLTHPAPA